MRRGGCNTVTVLVATSVVRGGQPGKRCGGVHLIDLESKRVARAIDWNAAGMGQRGHELHGGPRGIAFDGDRVFIGSSEELFVFSPAFEPVGSYRCPYLHNGQEISVYRRRLYLASADYDSIIGFDLDRMQFSWGLHIAADGEAFRAIPFNPGGSKGPQLANHLGLNSVHCEDRGMFIGGLRTGGLLLYGGRHITRHANLPEGAHNARPWRGGVLFNDTEADVVRFVTADLNRVFRLPHYPPEALTHTRFAGSARTRQAFARGLCTLDDRLIAAGSSPATITLHDVEAMKTTLSINLSMDVRNSIFGLAVWPFSDWKVGSE